MLHASGHDCLRARPALEWHMPTPLRRLRLEFGLLFLALPLVLAAVPSGRWKIPALLAITVSCMLLLRRDPEFDGRNELCPRAFNDGLRRVALRVLFIAPLLAALVLALRPEAFLEFPLRRPVFWAVVMVLYPLLSALPQEFLYRTFFFHRYRPLFPTPAAMTVASATAFSVLHIMYWNVPALALSFAGGLLLGRTYNSSRSLLLVSLEHALYGCLAFTLGLGRFFYNGPR